MRLRPVPAAAIEKLVPRLLVTTDIRAKWSCLGTGTSVGVPAIGCGCEVCRSTNPKNRRTRCQRDPRPAGGNLLIDTAPDMRQQLLREGIGIVHAVLYTHEHADHIFGLDDLRLMQFYLGGPVPLYCEANVEERIRKSFDYAFSSPRQLASAAPCRQLRFHRITTEPFEVLGSAFTPIRLQHGPRFDVLGFRIGNVAYCTDVNAIPPRKHGVLTGPRRAGARRAAAARRTRPISASTKRSGIARQLAPRQTYFTHMSHELEHEATNASLPNGHGARLRRPAHSIDVIEPTVADRYFAAINSAPRFSTGALLLDQACCPVPACADCDLVAAQLFR